MPSRLEGASGIRPGARPVDRYVKPVDTTANTEQFVRGLTFLGGAAAVMGAKYLKSKEEKDYKEGQRWAETQDNAMTPTGDSEEAKAVRVGALPAGRSKAFRRGASEALGQSYAMRYNTDFTVHMKAATQGATTPEEVRRAGLEFDNKWREANIPESLMSDNDFLDSFQGRIRDAQFNTLLSQIAAAENRVMEQAQENLSGLAANISSDYLAGGDSDGDIPALEQFNLRIESLRQQHYAMGMPGATVNELVYNAIAKVAVDNARPDLISAAREHTVNGAPLPPAIQARLQAASVAAARNKRERTQEQRDVEEETFNTIARDAAEAIRKAQGGAVDMSTFADRVMATNPAWMGRFNSIVQEFRDATHTTEGAYSDSAIYDAIQSDREHASTVLFDLWRKRAITPEQLDRHQRWAANVEQDSRPSNSSTLRSRIGADFRRRLREGLAGKGWSLSEDTDVVNTQFLAWDNAVDDYWEANPAATEVDARKYFRELLGDYIVSPAPRAQRPDGSATR